MSRSRISHILAIGTVFVGALGISAGGCVEAEGRFYVAGFCPDPASGSSTGCEEEGISQYDLSAECVGDSCVNEGATAYIRLLNKIESSLDYEGNYNNVETSDILLTGYDVRLNTGGAEEEFAYNLSGSVVAQGETIVPVQLIPVGEAGSSILQAVEAGGEPVAGWAGVRVYGRTTGGLDVETPEAFIPVNLLP